MSDFPRPLPWLEGVGPVAALDAAEPSLALPKKKIHLPVLSNARDESIE